ncbi:hypothetical protein [Pseudomonas phage vB_PseudoP-SA22]|nr:hypothetical protein [Pseudomonas phage vB_PseudoP-SA22]
MTRTCRAIDMTRIPRDLGHRHYPRGSHQHRSRGHPSYQRTPSPGQSPSVPDPPGFPSYSPSLISSTETHPRTAPTSLARTVIGLASESPRKNRMISNSIR